MSMTAPSFNGVSTRVVRAWLLGGMLLLLMVIVASIVYTRLRAERYLLGLPGKLGIDIKQESDGFTYSQSVGGRTVFTVHAAKEIQHTNGKITLHDVGIVLYGRKQDRPDRIHGNEFDYDQASGTMSAIGEVFIDLDAPAKPSGSGQPATVASGDESQMIHVKTSGLIFHQKERSASTEEAIEFNARGVSGKAIGAFYDSANGLLVLKSAVQVSGLRREHSAVLRAAHAELHRAENVLHLESAHYAETGDHGSQSAAAERADVYLNDKGQAQKIDAEGAVTLGGDPRGTLIADRMQVQLNADEQPRQGHLTGRVHFARDEAGSATRGHAGDALIQFDAVGRPIQARLTGDVELDRSDRKTDRRLLAARLLLGLSGGGKEPVLVRAAEASGGVAATAGRGARLRISDQAQDGGTTTDVFGDTLTGAFAASGTSSQLTGLDARGSTSVERTSTNRAGAIKTRDKSTGDLLRLAFTTDAQGKTELSTAEQRGHVETLRDTIGKPTEKGQAAGAHAIEHARSDATVYDARSEQVQLTGGVQIAEADDLLSADRVTLNRRTGGAMAEGAVRASYVAPGTKPEPGRTAEPIHVTAARAVANRATGVTDFFAADGATARMWQGGSQVEAPVLHFERNPRRLVAHGLGPGDEVRAVLVGSAAGGAGKSRNPGLVRVASREMTYTDSLREIELTGKVRLNDASGSLRSNAATIYLAPTGSGSSPVKSASTSLMLGKVDRVIGEGAVEMEQPGRRATGEKIVYTASDGSFVLTGTKAVPPKLIDESRGTVTGAALLFRSGDDSVVISGQDGSEHGRVRTETRVPQ